MDTSMIEWYIQCIQLGCPCTINTLNFNVVEDLLPTLPAFVWIVECLEVSQEEFTTATISDSLTKHQNCVLFIMFCTYNIQHTQCITHIQSMKKYCFCTNSSIRKQCLLLSAVNWIYMEWKNLNILMFSGLRLEQGRDKRVEYVANIIKNAQCICRVSRLDAGCNTALVISIIRMI